MNDKSQKVYMDERTVQLERKLGNEVAFFAIIMLVMSIFLKILIWHIPLEGYFPEILLILGMEIYAGVRSWQLGLDIKRYNPAVGMKSFKSRLAEGATVAIILVAIFFVDRNFLVRRFFSQYPFLQFIFVLALITSLTSLWDKLVHYFHQKRQALLDQELEEE